ncbi:MAG: DUF1446 domain-containing protein [Alphaproteobacteria bacterium]|nr:DUF1446 domain-containing protein [Alphaproteobacteria bacterium]
MARTVKIGCGTGFWGDSPEGAAQLVRSGGVDYMILDYLAEITMSILARLKARSPDQGYATDFVSHVMAPLAQQIAEQGIRVITNAGGLNPEACRTALQSVFDAAGVDLKIAVILGDDLTDQAESLRADGVKEMASGEPLPERISSINAYLGAFPIAAALAEGADIVITGRVVDSALALGPLIHEFGWAETDYDKLAGGSLAGHVIECGPQATGGIFTDWQSVLGWDEMGFPIAVCAEDGSFELTKPQHTGGLITPMTVAEQIVYEIGDPAAYILPDVICDFSRVTASQIAENRVRVTGAQGSAPTPFYKVCATYADGYRSVATMTIAGNQAAPKAQAVGEAILARSSRLIAAAGFEPYSETLIEVLGADASYGSDPVLHPSREVVLRIAVRHQQKDALGIFAREIYPSASSMAQGITGFAGGRPAPQPVIRLYSCLVKKHKVSAQIGVNGQLIPVSVPMGNSTVQTTPNVTSAADKASTGKMISVPLLALAHGRSGDKGDISNIGVLARNPDFLPYLRTNLTPARVKDVFAHVAKGPVERYEWPGLNGFNFVLRDALGGGGVASLRNDPQGKCYAQILLDTVVQVPSSLLDKFPSLATWSDQENQQKGLQ